MRVALEVRALVVVGVGVALSGRGVAVGVAVGGEVGGGGAAGVGLVGGEHALARARKHHHLESLLVSFFIFFSLPLSCQFIHRGNGRNFFLSQIGKQHTTSNSAKITMALKGIANSKAMLPSIRAKLAPLLIRAFWNHLIRHFRKSRQTS